MKHLAAEDVVDVVDGCARGDLVRHADQCPACREEIEAFRHAQDLAATDTIPEPSPLFWTQFSARVHESIKRAPAPEGWWAGRSWGWRTVPVGVLVVAVVLVSLVQWPRPDRGASQRAGTAAGLDVDQADSWDQIAADDEPWALVSQLMADVTAEEVSAADLSTTIGSADRAVASLSEGEKEELARMLRAELGESDESLR